RARLDRREQGRQAELSRAARCRSRPADRAGRRAVAPPHGLAAGRPRFEGGVAMIAASVSKSPNDATAAAEPVSGARLVVEALAREGVRHVFGYPGGAIMPVYDALPGSGLNHILVRHEQAAALAADAYGRVTGEPGVCIATSGPG